MSTSFSLIWFYPWNQILLVFILLRYVYFSLYSYVDKNQALSAFPDFSVSMVKQCSNNDAFVGDKIHKRPGPPDFDPPGLESLFGVDMHASCKSLFRFTIGPFFAYFSTFILFSYYLGH